MNDHPLTFKELLRLSGANPQVWISDQPAVDILIDWVALTVDDVGPGDVFLTSGINLSPKVAEQTWKRGGVALIIVGDSPLGESQIPSEIPVVAVPKETNLRALYRTMLTILVNQRAYLMERGVRIHTQLSQIAAEGDGLSGLARAMLDLSGRGVLVQDKRLGILAEYPSSALHAIWDDVLVQLLDIENLPGEFHDRKRAGKYITIKQQSLPGELERIITPISVGGVARGYLSLVDMTGMLDSLDYLVAEQGALVCAVEMARAKAVREAEKRLKGNLLTALLQENITPRDANLWVQSMGLDLNQAHVAIRFAWDSSAATPSMRRLETLVNGEVSRQDYRVIVESMGAEVVCICELAPVAGRPDIALTLGNAVLERAKEEYPEVPARCGLGVVAAEMNAWRVSFQQAGQALEMARRLREARPLYYPDLSVYRLLLQLEHHPELQSFKTKMIGPLLSYEGGGELLHTLEVYFDHNGNLSQAADALFIHRNTLTYRMDRIAEVSGLDLNNTETRLAAQLALRIHRMTDRQE